LVAIGSYPEDIQEEAGRGWVVQVTVAGEEGGWAVGLGKGVVGEGDVGWVAAVMVAVGLVEEVGRGRAAGAGGVRGEAGKARVGEVRAVGVAVAVEGSIEALRQAACKARLP
jgi:hypothetical protein